MACVTVQLGQCGTQLGHHLLSSLHDDAKHSSSIVSSNANEEYTNASLSTFFQEARSGQHEARSVMIDMEAKAVNCALQGTSGKGWSYPKEGQFCQKSGSGNNWSYGYKVHAPQCREPIMDMVQHEVEKCDHFGGFLVLSSLAGGTGSGLGSYITGSLRDAFPHASILNPVVCPYTEGEVAVQSYNALLSLAHTCDTADASILLHNDHVHRICEKLLGIKHVSFNDVNGVVAKQLASLLQPVTFSSDGNLSMNFRNVLNEIVYTSACHGQYTMLDLKSIPHVAQASVAYSTFSWDSLIKRIYQMMITDFYMDEGLDWHRKLSVSSSYNTGRHPRYVSNLVVMRGKQALAPPESENPDFQNPVLYPAWIPASARCPIWKINRPFEKIEKSVALLSNGTSCVKPLDDVVSKAWQMYGARAYLHQYTKNAELFDAILAVLSWSKEGEAVIHS
ncbi:unnamed protein product [Clavelina lepadiformis]|uniref:Tubulin delta chain n=1 Tax=Clavelina lepadiformis TaxID=159417 RepID=A0ABP0FP81_CLALP